MEAAGSMLEQLLALLLACEYKLQLAAQGNFALVLMIRES